MQVEDEGEIQHLGTNKYIQLVSCISNLFTSWHCLLKSRSLLHGYLLGTYRCGIRILSAMVWSQGGADYTASPFSRAQLLELWYSCTCMLLTRVIWSSHADLWFGSSQANRSVFNTLSWHALPVGGCVTQHVNNQPPSW